MRARRLGAIAALAVLAGLWLGRCGGGPKSPPVTTTPLERDPRIAELLVPCVQGGFYDKGVADVVPILIEKLKKSGGEPLKRAKEELGASGEEGGSALARLFDQYFSDPMADPYLENALDAASLNAGKSAHDLLLRALSHARESVRQRAMMGLAAGRARPADFDVFVERLEGSDTHTLRALYARALFVADRGRAELVVLRWMRAKRQEDVWNDVVHDLAQARSEEVVGLAAGIFSALDPFFGVWVAVPPAVAGDASALEYLRAEREHEAPERRLAAVGALSEGGLVQEILPALEDPDAQVRVLAVNGVARGRALESRFLDRLASKLADGSPLVRGLALKELCRHADAAAIDQALQGLGSGPEFLEESLRALLEPMGADPSLARRAYDRIVERYRSEEHRPLQQRTATLKAMGIVPLREAAAFLREVALAAEGETIESLRAHEWVMIQASNTGAAGRAFLFEELEHEADPLRRLDLVSAVGSARDDAAREALLLFVEERARNPFEILYAASRLAKIGPARRIAPRLKRVAIRIEDGKIRSAFHCLLWIWY